MKIVTILGARPQFIKASAVSRELIKRNQHEVIIHTGQHYDKNMSEIFFDEMGIPFPKYNLNINGLGQGAMIGQMMEKIEPLLIDLDPNIVLLYGDTNSTLAGALTARKLNTPIAHVEGGLRNFDLTIPEDVNRIITDRISDIIFYSTNVAKVNLDKEGYGGFPIKLIKTDDLMSDTIKYYKDLAKIKSKILSEIDINGREYVLCTVHRNSNVSLKCMIKIVNALNVISKRLLIIFPMHPNTKKIIKNNSLRLSKNIICTDPVGYLDMLNLIHHCQCVITDSGGVQREAYLMRKKSLLLMEYTPWEELIDNSFSQLSKISGEEIIKNYNVMLRLDPDYNMSLYGSGNAASQIVDALIKFEGS